MVKPRRPAVVPPGYDPRAFPPVAVTVDMAILTIGDGALQVLLIERGAEPYRGTWALPGGFVRPDESLDEAATRELAEETGLHRENAHLEQIGAYGDPHRDPRMRVITVAYLGLIARPGAPVAGTDATRARFIPVDALNRDALAFDHGAILADALDRARNRLEDLPVASSFCRDPFTLAELRSVYEAVWGVSLDHANFRRKVLAIDGFVTPLGTFEEPGPSGGRPAEFYTKGPATRLTPPFRRP